MGCDIHVALGKMKQLAIGHDTKEQALSIPHLSQVPVYYSQFEFLDYDSTVKWEVDAHRDLGRNYNLFSWLAGVRGDLEPVMRDQQERLHDIAYKFVQWAIGEHLRISVAGGKSKNNTESHFEYLFVTGDHSHMVYPISFLRDFDYTQQTRVSRKEEWESIEDYHDRLKEYQGKTYRDVFPDGWFGFLDWAHANGWHFTIMTFDS